MTDLLKKIFTVGVVTTTIMWSVGATLVLPGVAQAADCPTLTAGQLIKVTGKPTIYAVNKNLEVLAFATGDEFKSWNLDLTYAGKYTAITMACYDTLKSPAAQPLYVGFRPGSFVVARESSDTTFVVEPNNTLAEVDPTVATTLYGTSYKKFTVPVTAWGTYVSRGSKITTATAHPGMFVKVNGVNYYVDATSKLREVTDAGLVANRVKPEFVRSVAAAVIAGLATGEKVDGALSELTDRTQGGLAVVATTPVTTGGALSVSLAADTPASGYAFASASRVPFTKVVFTAGSSDVTVDSFKVKRAGVAAVDADFSSINVVTPEGSLLNDSGKTPNSDHEVTFTEDLKIPAGTSKTYTLVGMMAAAATMTAGNVPKLALTEVVSNAASTTGLPVEGNAMTTNESLSLGTGTIGEGAVIGTVTKQVGATNVNVANVKITNTGSTDTKSVKVEKLTLYNSGTAADADISSIKLKFNGNLIATAPLVNKYVTFDLSACGADCTIEKGYDKTFEAFADLTAGSGRNVNLDVQYATHVAVKDVNNNIYLSFTPSSPTAYTNTITVSQGKLNVTKTDTVQAGNVAANGTSALASWNFKVTGEPIDVRTLVFKITTTNTVVPTGLDSLVLYDAAGKALIGSLDGVGATSPGYATSTDTFTLQPGDNILTLKAKVDSTALANDTITIAIDMSNTSNFIARGVNSSLDITLGTATPYATPNSVVSANIQTVKTSALLVTTLSTPAAMTYTGGRLGVTFSKVMFDASNSSEDVKVSQVIITDTTGAAGKTIDIQSVKLYVDKDGDSYDGDNTLEALTETVSGSDTDAGDNEDFTFNLSGADQFVVKKGAKIVMEVRGDITGGAATGATATHTFSMDTANDVSATGLTTNTTVTETISTATANAVTVGASGGQVGVTLASDNPAASLVAAGTTVTLASFNFLATSTEDVELDYLYLTQVTTNTVSSSYMDYDEIWFVNESGTEVLGTRMSPTSTFPKLDFADDALIVPANDTDGVNLYLKAKLAVIGTGGNGTTDHHLGYKIAAAATDVVAKGNLSGSGALEFEGSTAPTGLSHYVYQGYPKLDKLAVPTNKLANGTMDLFKFKITAVNGDVALWKFTFDFATTVATVTNLYVYDVTDSSSEKELNTTAGTAPYNVWELAGSSWDGTGASNNQVTVSKTQPRTFVVRGNVAGSGTGASVSVRIAGDAAHTVTGYSDRITTEVDSDANDEFIWSDKNASGHTVSTNDWTNGYLVSGLSSISSSAETISY